MNQRYFLKLFKNKTDNFFKRPQKKIDKRKSRKVTSRNAKNQKKKTWNTEGKQDDARRNEKQEIKHRGREVKKQGRLNFIVKNEFFLAKQIRR